MLEKLDTILVSDDDLRQDNDRYYKAQIIGARHTKSKVFNIDRRSIG